MGKKKEYNTNKAQKFYDQYLAASTDEAKSVHKETLGLLKKAMKYDPYHIPSLRTYAAYLVENDQPNYAEAEKLYVKAANEIEKHLTVTNLHIITPPTSQQHQKEKKRSLGFHSINHVTVVSKSSDKNKATGSLWFRFAGDCLSAFASLLCTMYSNADSPSAHEQLMKAARYFILGFSMCEIVQTQTLCDAGILFKNFLGDAERAEEWFELAVIACARDEKMTPVDNVSVLTVLRQILMMRMAHSIQEFSHLSASNLTTVLLLSSQKSIPPADVFSTSFVLYLIELFHKHELRASSKSSSKQKSSKVMIPSSASLLALYRFCISCFDNTENKQRSNNTTTSNILGADAKDKNDKERGVGISSITNDTSKYFSSHLKQLAILSQLEHTLKQLTVIQNTANPASGVTTSRLRDMGRQRKELLEMMIDNAERDGSGNSNGCSRNGRSGEATTAVVSPCDQLRSALDESQSNTTNTNHPGGGDHNREGRKKCANPSCDVRESKSVPFKRCGRCKSVCYHDVACQRVHWKTHKKVCKA